MVIALACESLFDCSNCGAVCKFESPGDRTGTCYGGVNCYEDHCTHSNIVVTTNTAKCVECLFDRHCPKSEICSSQKCVECASDDKCAECAADFNCWDDSRIIFNHRMTNILSIFGFH